MKTYEYEGFDKDKKPDKGTVEASTGEEAILYLLQSGIYPTALIELSAGQARSNIKLNNLKLFREKLKAPPVAQVQPVPTPVSKDESWFLDKLFMRYLLVTAACTVTVLCLVKLFMILHAFLRTP